MRFVSKNFDRKLEQLFPETGATSVFVVLTLGLLVLSLAFGVTIGVSQNAYAVTKTAAETIALEAARDCQTQTSLCTLATVKTHAQTLAAKYGVSVDVQDITLDTTDLTEPTRYKVRIAVSKTWAVPLLGLFTASGDAQDISQTASASWTIGVALKTSPANYLRLFINSCNVPSLRIPSTKTFDLKTDASCDTLDTPKVIWGGGTGASAVNCSANFLTTTDTVDSIVTLPQALSVDVATSYDCVSNRTYWAPLISNVVKSTASSSKTYTVTWKKFVLSKSGSSDKDFYGSFSSTGCSLNWTEDESFITKDPSKYCTPDPTADLLKANPGYKFLKSEFGSSKLNAATGQSTVQATIVGFRKVRLIKANFKTVNKLPAHTFTVSYGGNDIKLVPNY
jgi:hypothetical protein